VERTIPQIDNTGEPSLLIDVGTYYYLESNKAKAMEYWTRGHEKRKESFTAALLALMALEQGRAQDAAKLVEEGIAIEQNTPRLRIYGAALAEMKRCLDDPNAIPAHVELLTTSPTDPEVLAARGNSCYYLGRLCELRGKTEEAKQWYELTLNTFPGTFIGRAMAADALRKLGVEFYK
jgi:tetratricopeptide (TPR) repeat protein